MALPQLNPDLNEDELDRIVDQATTASNFLKAISHEGRLMILCQLGEGEMSVSDLLERIDLSQSALSQHLAKLRKAELVGTRQESQTVYYSITDPAAAKLIKTLAEIFCPEDA